MQLETEWPPDYEVEDDIVWDTCAGSSMAANGNLYDSDRGIISDCENEAESGNDNNDEASNYIGVSFGNFMNNPESFPDIAKYIFEFLSFCDLFTIKLVSHNYHNMISITANEDTLIQIYAKNIYNTLKYGTLLNKNSLFYQRMTNDMKSNKSGDSGTNGNMDNEKYLIDEWLFMDENNCLFSSLKVNTFSQFIERILPLFTRQIYLFLEKYESCKLNGKFTLAMTENGLFNRYGYVTGRYDIRHRDTLSKQLFMQLKFGQIQEKAFKTKQKTNNFRNNKESIKIIVRFCNLVVGDVFKIWNKKYDIRNKYFSKLMEIFSYFARQAYIKQDNPFYDHDTNVYVWESLLKWLLLTFDDVFYKNQKISWIYQNNQDSHKFNQYLEPAFHSWYEFMFLLQYQTKRYFQTFIDIYQNSVTLNDKKRLLGKNNYNPCYDNEYKKPFVNKLLHVIKHLSRKEKDGQDEPSLQLENNGTRFGKEYKKLAHSWCDTVLAFKMNNLLSMYILSNDRMNTIYDCQEFYYKCMGDVWNSMSCYSEVDFAYKNNGMTMIDSILNKECNLIISKLFDSSYHCLMNNDPIYQCIKELDFHLWRSNMEMHNDIQENEYEFVASFKQECINNGTRVIGNDNKNNGNSLSRFAFSSLKLERQYIFYENCFPKRKKLDYGERINHDNLRWFQFLSEKNENKRLGYA